MISSVNGVLPPGVTVDAKAKKRHKKNTKSTFSLKLLFRERCPEASDICKLHPAIKSVFVPSRPASARYCILKFKSVRNLEEVRSALHGKHIEPYRGVLKCSDTTSKILSKLPGLNRKHLKQMHLTQTEIKHTKMINKEATVDVKLNSAERELFVRYGISSRNHRV